MGVGGSQHLEDLRPGLGIGKVVMPRGHLNEHLTLAVSFSWGWHRIPRVREWGLNQRDR